MDIELGTADILGQSVTCRDSLTLLLINARSLFNRMSELRTLVLVARPTVVLITE